VIARWARRIGRLEDATRLEADAERLRERFDKAFWCPDLGTYALALDGAKRPCRVRTSNAGQLLFTGIVPASRAAQLAEGLMEPRFFSGWGIRTVAKGEVRYNPMSYHNGSVWPHDNALIALGMARYGLKRPVGKLFKGLFDAATYMDLRRLPELFCGFQRQRSRGPTLYPVACSPQAWASAAPFSLIEASLGLEIDSRHHQVRLHNPRLPSFVDHVTVHNLRVGNGSTDIKVRRHGDDVSLEILQSRGADLQISMLCSR
jgi:glycogen debranching enzyme